MGFYPIKSAFIGYRFNLGLFYIVLKIVFIYNCIYYFIGWFFMAVSSISSCLKRLRGNSGISANEPSLSPKRARRGSGGIGDIPDTMTSSSVSDSTRMPEPSTPEKPKEASFAFLSPKTPEKSGQLPRPSPSKFKSPEWYHDINSLEKKRQKGNKSYRSFSKQLEKYPEKPRTLIVSKDSPAKDLQKIREKLVQEDGKGCFEVPSQSCDGSRIWSVHNESLYPVKGRGGCKDRRDFVVLKARDLKRVLEGSEPIEQKLRLSPDKPKEEEGGSSDDEASPGIVQK